MCYGIVKYKYKYKYKYSLSKKPFENLCVAALSAAAGDARKYIAPLHSYKADQIYSTNGDARAKWKRMGPWWQLFFLF